MANHQVDVLIIGAGPSGDSAAALIQRAGFNVEVVEKEKFFRFVIGESLLPRSMDLLEEAGLLEAVQKQQYIVKPGAVFFRGSDVCTFKFSAHSKINSHLVARYFMWVSQTSTYLQ